MRQPWSRLALIGGLSLMASSVLHATVGIALARSDWIVLAADSIETRLQLTGAPVGAGHTCKIGGTKQVVAAVAGLVFENDFNVTTLVQAAAQRHPDAFSAIEAFQRELSSRLPTLIAQHRNALAYRDWTERHVPVVSVIFASFTDGVPEVERCSFLVDSTGRPQEPVCDRSHSSLDRLEHFEIGRTSTVAQVLRAQPNWPALALQDPAHFVQDVILKVSVAPGVADVGPPVTVVRFDIGGLHIVERGVCRFGV